MSDRCVRTIITTNSLWIIDFNNMEFQRHPRHEEAEGTAHVPYDQTVWTAFVAFSQYSCPDDIEELAGMIRFTISLSMAKEDWITTTYDPKDQ